jgi:hypothetical protein
LSSALGQLYKTVTLGICGHVQAPGLDALKALSGCVSLESVATTAQAPDPDRKSRFAVGLHGRSLLHKSVVHRIS